jgi:hypothetical protein
MFAKITKTIVERRGSVAPARATAFRANRNACNDNRPGRGLGAAAPRIKRAALACRWQVAPTTGALECVWHTEPAGDAAGEEPSLRRRARLAA